MNIDEVSIGTPFYRCYMNLDQHKVVETWIYYGYEKFEHTTPDCDLPFHFFKFGLHGGSPQSPYFLAIPNKRHFKRSMLTWDKLLKSMSKLDT